MRREYLDRILKAVSSKRVLLYGLESSGKTKLASIIAREISLSGGKVIYAFNSPFNKESFASTLTGNAENVLMVSFRKFSVILPLLLRAVISGYTLLIIDVVPSLSEQQDPCELSLFVALLSEVVRRFNSSLLIIVDERPEGSPIFQKIFLKYIDEVLHVQRHGEELKVRLLSGEELSLSFEDLFFRRGRIL